MSKSSSDFFSGKRPWSKIKDQILGSYLTPYLNKVNKLGNKIIIVDGFAGQGKFDDGSIGSPFMICQIAKKSLGTNFTAVLVNKEKKYHDRLTKLTKEFIDLGCAVTIHGTAEDLLKKLNNIIGDESILVYLDQFGISGSKFSTILPYLIRKQIYSTELILNISVPIIHRLSAKNTQNPLDSKVIQNREILTEVFGGDYWMKYLFDRTIEPNEQINLLMQEYKMHLKKYLPYVGFCPVHEKGKKSTLKYCVFFASRHPDSALLLNDSMFSAYWAHIWDCTFKSTLFEFQDKSINLPSDYYMELKSIIIGYLSSKPYSRKELWQCIINEYFMRFHSTHFKKEIHTLVSNHKINFIDVKGTKRLNDESILKLN